MVFRGFKKDTRCLRTPSLLNKIINSNIRKPLIRFNTRVEWSINFLKKVWAFIYFLYLSFNNQHVIIIKALITLLLSILFGKMPKVFMINNIIDHPVL